MQRSLRIVCFLILCFTLSSCNFDPYYEKRPFDYGTSKWICTEPIAWFDVNPDDDDYYSPKGKIQLNDETMQIQLFFVHETNRVLVSVTTDTSNNKWNENSGFEGECIFSPEKLVIKIDKNTDVVFDGKYDKIVFERENTGSTAFSDS